jgi:TetR/AcrR family transcriptional regulator, fatty acid metabolism regulator protein
MRSDGRSGGGRQRSFTEQARRAQIVDEAIRTIADLGYANASLGQIAQRLEISKGVISYHFMNKEELLDQVVEAVVREAEAYSSPALETAKTAHDRLKLIIELSLSFLRTHLSHILALREIANVKAEPARDAIRTSYRRSVVDIEDTLKDGQRTGEFRDFSPRVMALTIKAAIDVVPPLVAADPRYDLDLHAQELVEAFTQATMQPRKRGR